MLYRISLEYACFWLIIIVSIENIFNHQKVIGILVKILSNIIQNDNIKTLEEE